MRKCSNAIQKYACTPEESKDKAVMQAKTLSCLFHKMNTEKVITLILVSLLSLNYTLYCHFNTLILCSLLSFKC